MTQFIVTLREQVICRAQGIPAKKSLGAKKLGVTKTSESFEDAERKAKEEEAAREKLAQQGILAAQAELEQKG